MRRSPRSFPPPLRLPAWLFVLGFGLFASVRAWAQPVIDPSTPRVFCDPRTPPALTVSATGGELSYQWYRGQPGDTSAPVAGATASTWSPPASTAGLEVFWVRVSDSGGTAESAAYSIARGGTRFAVGAGHSLFVEPDGSAWTTGANHFGQLGDGTLTHRSAPVQIMHHVAAVAAGTFHSLFLKTDGSVWAAGSNNAGQLGAYDTFTRYSTPFLVITGVVAISTGDAHSLFLKADGSVWATGNNSSGQLADGTTASRAAPVQVMTGVVAISAGFSHSLFLKADGSVWVAGNNSYGQLGDGSTANRTTPVQVLTGVAALSAGGNVSRSHSLFLKVDGSVWATGSNSAGQFGDGTTTTSSTPVQVLAGVAALSAGSSHSLFLKPDGTAWGCGSSGNGQLGLGSSGNGPTPVQIMTGVAAIETGNTHSIFLKSDDSIWATGTNTTGQLGDGSTTNRTTPVTIVFPPGADTAPLQVFCNPSTPPTFTAPNPGDALAWQWYRGQPDDLSSPIPGATTATWSPPASTAGLEVFWVRVSRSGGGSDTAAYSIARVGTRFAAGSSHSLFLRSDGSVWATGRNNFGQLGDGSTTNRPAPVPIMTDAAGIDTGSSYSLFLKTDGSAWGTGLNSDGQLGDRSIIQRSTPVQLMTGVVALSAGSSHGLFLKADGSVWAAGYNGNGQLGDGSTTSRSTPVQVMTGVAAVSAGSNHSLFLKLDGSVWAAGHNDYGQLGDGSLISRPTPVPIMTGVAAFSAGGNHSIFLKTDGSVWTVGFNHHGRLGDGTGSGNSPTIARRSTPVEIMTGVASVSAGYYHSLMLKIDGSAWACGSNDYGQLGSTLTPGSPASTDRPTPVQTMTGVAALAAGSEHSLFLKSDDSIWASGRNIEGQLGDDTTISRTSPVLILFRAPQSIAFANPGPHIFGDAPIVLAPAASSGLPVTLAVVAGPATVEGYTVALTGPGTVTLRATQAGDAAYSSATPVEQSFTVLPAWTSPRDADPDGDGLPNLLEYALGLDDQVADSSPVIFARGETRLTLSFPRVADPSLTYTVEATSELTGSWNVIWTSTGMQNAAGPVTVADEVDLAPATPRRFLRLRVTAP